MTKMQIVAAYLGIVAALTHMGVRFRASIIEVQPGTYAIMVVGD